MSQKINLIFDGKANKRLVHIERAKGLAIALVVLGHLVSGDPPPDNLWYIEFRNTIYEFHMPFFMYLSGYIFFFANYHEKQLSSSYLSSRTKRLLIPFFAIGLLILIGKTLASAYFSVDNLPTSPSDGFKHLFFQTTESPARSIWYVFVLFVYSIFTPLLWRLGRKGFSLLLLVGAILYVAPKVDVLYLDKAFRFYIFFVAGGYVGRNEDIFLVVYEKYFIHTSILFIMVVAYFWPPFPAGNPDPTLLAAIGFTAIPALHGAVLQRTLTNDKVFLFFGLNSFSIYLFNTIAIGVTKAALLKVMPFGGKYFIPSLLVLFLGGTLMPIFFRRSLLVKNRFMFELTR